MQSWGIIMDNFEELKELLEKSFLPLKCEVGKFDYDEYLKIRIRDISNKVIYEIDKISFDIYEYPTKLNTLIFEVRHNLIANGFNIRD